VLQAAQLADKSLWRELVRGLGNLGARSPWPFVYRALFSGWLNLYTHRMQANERFAVLKCHFLSACKLQRLPASEIIWFLNFSTASFICIKPGDATNHINHLTGHATNWGTGLAVVGLDFGPFAANAIMSGTQFPLYIPKSCWNWAVETAKMLQLWFFHIKNIKIYIK